MNLTICPCGFEPSILEEAGGAVNTTSVTIRCPNRDADGVHGSSVRGVFPVGDGLMRMQMLQVLENGWNESCRKTVDAKAPTINELWRGYLLDVVPAAASETQVNEARTAFYFGALSIIDSLEKLGSTRNPDLLMKTLLGWRDEGRNYADAVKNQPKPPDPA